MCILLTFIIVCDLQYLGIMMSYALVRWAPVLQDVQTPLLAEQCLTDHEVFSNVWSFSSSSFIWTKIYPLASRTDTSFRYMVYGQLASEDNKVMVFYGL